MDEDMDIDASPVLTGESLEAVGRVIFERMLAVSVIVAVAASFLGVYLSFFINSAPAPTIVLLLSAIFAAAFWRSRAHAARVERMTAIGGS